MLKNCVFKVDVYTKQWFKSTIIRAIKTFAQVAASMITVGIGGLPEAPAVNTDSEDLEDNTYKEVEDLKEGDL